MKKHNDIEKIDELFRNTLENAEFEVPGATWNAIESGIESQAHAAGQAGGLLAKGALIKGAAILVAAGIAVGSYFYLTNSDTVNTKPSNEYSAVNPNAADSSIVAQDKTSVNPDQNKLNPENTEEIIIDESSQKDPSTKKQTIIIDKSASQDPGAADKGTSSPTELPKDKQNQGLDGSKDDKAPASKFWFVLSDTVICRGDAVTVTSYLDPSSVKWFIDGIQYYPTAASFSLRFERGGFYDIRMQTSDQKVSRTLYVDAVEGGYKVTYLDKGRYRFVSSSKGARTCEWDFGDGSATQRGNTVEHTFPAGKEVANYRVVLTAHGKGSCSDTFGMEVQNRYTGKKYGAPVLPNAFSPNGDGTNDKLELSWDGDGPCVIVITDLKGDRVWESKDAVNQFWDGTNMFNGGKMSPNGQYFATVRYRDQDGLVKTMNVLITLMQ